jgi:hypothetical protein
MPEKRKPPRVGEPKIDFLLSVNRLIEAAEDARQCRDELLESLPTERQDAEAQGRKEVEP